MLLQLRGQTGYMEGHWGAGAAGHVEPGESVYDAACREAAEELGITLTPGDLTPVCAMQRRAPGSTDPVDERVDYFLTARSWQGEPRRMEPRKNLALGWYRLDDLPDPVVPHELVVLEGLLAGHLPAVVVHGF